MSIFPLSNDVPPPFNSTSYANEKLLYVIVGGAQVGRQVRRDISVLSFVIATIEITCQGCELEYWKVIAKFHLKNDLCYKFLKEHGVLPAAVQCPHCHSQELHALVKVLRVMKLYLVNLQFNQ